MSLHTKWDYLLSLHPDVAIIAECAEPRILWSKRKTEPECAVQWIGENPNKGLGVFAFPGYSLERDESYDVRFKYFLPINISGHADCSLLAVWAFNGRTNGPTTSYGAETMSALDYYQNFMNTQNSVIAGDFNDSVVWDHHNKVCNFSAIASRLERTGLTSAYHKFMGVPFGSEPDKTLFFRKGPLEYHIDYCFLPRQWNLNEVSVGMRQQWIGISDHAPLAINCIADPSNYYP